MKNNSFLTFEVTYAEENSDIFLTKWQSHGFILFCSFFSLCPAFFYVVHTSEHTVKQKTKLNIINIAQADINKNTVPTILSWLLRKYHEGFYYCN